jgi:hypothetical protein
MTGRSPDGAVGTLGVTGPGNQLPLAVDLTGVSREIGAPRRVRQ